MDYLCGYTATLESKMISLLQPPPAPATPLGVILLPSHSTSINRENIYFEVIISHLEYLTVLLPFPNHT